MTRPHDNAADFRIADLAAQLAQERNLRLTIAEPLAKAVIQALDAWCDIAQDPRHPGHAAALRLLKAWKSTIARADQVGSGLVVGVAAPPNGQD